MPSEKRILWGLVQLTFAVVLVLGGITFLTLLSDAPRAQVEVREPASTTAQVVNVIEENDRHKLTDDELLVEDLGCLKKGSAKVLKVTAKQIRLTGKLCRVHDSLVDGSIINRTNGFHATFFQPVQNEFMTDYIDLAEGQNQVLVTLKKESGSKIVSKIQIDRMPTRITESK